MPPIISNSGEITKQSTGEPFFHPFIIACAKACVVSKILLSRSRRLAIGSRRLGVRPNSALGIHVLMKFSFRNSMIRSSESSPALSALPLPQQASSKSGPSTEITWIGFPCAGAISNTSSNDTQLIF